MTFDLPSAIRAAGGLVGIPDIAKRLKVTRQQAYQYTQRSDFPEPVDYIGRSGVWIWAEVERWNLDRLGHQP